MDSGGNVADIAKSRSVTGYVGKMGAVRDGAFAPSQCLKRGASFLRMPAIKPGSTIDAFAKRAGVWMWRDGSCNPVAYVL